MSSVDCILSAKSDSEPGFDHQEVVWAIHRKLAGATAVGKVVAALYNFKELRGLSSGILSDCEISYLYLRTSSRSEDVELGRQRCQ